jgi:glycosyltransferase involved in cell wall biosynthesis
VTNPSLPYVSIVVPTRNRSALLADCLASLSTQDYPANNFEIVVVDDGSTDRTPEIVERFANRPAAALVRYVRLAGTGVNAARNAGIRVAHGDPVCFVDDDIDAPISWLTNLVGGAIRYSEAGCLGGPIRLRIEGSPPPMCGREMLGETELDLGNADAIAFGVCGANMLLRRSALEEVGNFNEALSGPGDEEEWQRRLRARHGCVVYVHDAWLWHRRTASDLRVRRLLCKRFSYGVKEVDYLYSIGDRVSPSKAFRELVMALGHAARYRCAVGLFAAIGRLGRLWGWMWHAGTSRVG